MVWTRQARTRLLEATSLSFSEYQIDQMPPYLAISHVWSHELFATATSGPTSMKKCEGYKMVKTALEQIPELSNVRHFWLDSWCIDQEDAEDKAHQIPLMREIYKQAQIVLVTLNHSFSFSQADWDSVVLSLQDAFRFVRGSFITRTPEAFACYNSPKLAKPLRRALDMVGELATNPWCKRVWTAQEYLLARDVFWIGLDCRPMHTVFEDLNCVVDVSYGQKATVLGVRELPTDPWSTSVANLVNLNRIRSGIDHASSSMDLAYNRNCFLSEDQIYGLMGASGIIIDASSDVGLEELWKSWWEDAVASGLVMWAMMRRPRISLPEHLRNSGNCIMPSLASRFDAFSGCGVNTGIQTYGPIKLHYGTLGVTGRVAGICKVITCLGELGHKASMIQDVITRASSDVDIITRFCETITSGCHGPAEVSTYVQWHCCDRERQPDQLDREEPNALTVNKDLPRYGNVYLATLQNGLCTTNILINTDDVPTGELLALDIGTKLDKGLTTSGGTELTERQIFMVVHVPQGVDRLRGTLHKVGMTAPVFVPRFSKLNRAKALCGYVLEDTFERYQIGGASCSYCHGRQTKTKAIRVVFADENGPKPKKRKQVPVSPSSQTKQDAIFCSNSPNPTHPRRPARQMPQQAPGTR